VHATPLLLAGVPAHVVAERLGHVEPSITLRVYAHVIRQQVADVAEVFARQVGDIDDALDDHDLRSLARPRVNKSVSKPGGQMRTVVNNKGPDSRVMPGQRPSCGCALGGIRTPNLLIRSQMLYPLSYERTSETDG
jgi:hypothetical protein